MSQGASGWRMPGASEPQRRHLACALQSRNKKQLAILKKIELKTNKSALYRIKLIM